MSGGRRKLTAEQVLLRINDWSEREPEEPEPVDHSDSQEVDHRENQDDHYSESEQSTDAETEDDGIDEGSTYIGKGGQQFTWKKTPPPVSRTRIHNIVSNSTGPTGAARSPRINILDSFSCLFDDSMIDTSKVYILSKVTIKNIKNGAEMAYTLVAENEADLKAKKISIESPIGKGLLGKSKGDIADVQTPNGIIQFEIIDIAR